MAGNPSFFLYLFLFSLPLVLWLQQGAKALFSGSLLWHKNHQILSFFTSLSHFLSTMLTLGQSLWHSYNQILLLFIQTFLHSALQGRQEAGALFSKQSLWCIDSYNSWISLFFISTLSPMQKTHQSALQVQQKAEALLQANHYDMDMIRDCAEKVLFSYNCIH